jgi:hypothetical protein
MKAGEMMRHNISISKYVSVALIITLVYLSFGFVFHFKWKSDLDACRASQIAQGEYVESEVFGNVLGLLFDVTSWPVYLKANLDNFGVPFATPCNHR